MKWLHFPVKCAAFHHSLPSSPKFQSCRSLPFYLGTMLTLNVPRDHTCPEPCRASSVKRQGHRHPELHPHWRQGRSSRKPKARQQSRQAGRQRKKPWGSGERVDQTEGHQEQRKNRSNWGKCQGHLCFDSSCKCSANISLWLPLPTFSVPGAMCQGPGGKCWDLLSALPAATLLNGSCLQLLVCSRTKSTGLSRALQNTTPGESAKPGMSKTALC